MEEIIDRSTVFEEAIRKRASQGERFGNYIIDIIGFYIFMFLLGIMIGVMNIVVEIPEEQTGYGLLLIFLIYMIYYSFFEHFFGKTPGKFITKTRVVTFEGYRPSFGNIIGRNLCRFIPFDAFSFLFAETGWHDQVSRTLVIKEVTKEY